MNNTQSKDFLDDNSPLAFIDNRYMSLAIQYFILGRIGCRMIFNPVCGNLYHLAFETLIKSYLNLTYSKNDLWKYYRHNLPRLWNEFKKKTGGKSLTRLDYMISDLHVWEDLRYLAFPNKSGAFGIETSMGHSPDPKQDPTQVINRKNKIYRIYLDDMDEIFQAIIVAMRVDVAWIVNNPSFQQGMEEYKKDNKYSIL